MCTKIKHGEIIDMIWFLYHNCNKMGCCPMFLQIKVGPGLDLDVTFIGKSQIISRPLAYSSLQYSGSHVIENSRVIL